MSPAENPSAAFAITCAINTVYVYSTQSAQLCVALHAHSYAYCARVKQTLQIAMHLPTYLCVAV